MRPIELLKSDGSLGCQGMIGLDGDIVEPHFISEKNKEKLQNKKANGWRVMPYSTA